MNRTLLFLCLLASTAAAEPTFTLRIADDEWATPDKQAHFAAGFSVALLTAVPTIEHRDMTTREIGRHALYNSLFWVAWELKDAILPYETWGRAGGDGFSYRDLTCSLVGVGLVALLLVVTS